MTALRLYTFIFESDNTDSWFIPIIADLYTIMIAVIVHVNL